MFWFHRNQINLFSNLFRYWSFCTTNATSIKRTYIAVTVLVHPAQAEKEKQTSPKNCCRFVSLHFNMPTRATIHLMCFISIRRRTHSEWHGIHWWGEAAHFSIIKSIFGQKYFHSLSNMLQWITKFPFLSSSVHEKALLSISIVWDASRLGPWARKQITMVRSFVQIHSQWD